MDNDLKKFDKNGNPLNLTSQASRGRQANWAGKYFEDPSSVEPTTEDIKCELQLQALTTVEPLSFLINFVQFKQDIEPYKDRWQPYLRREGVLNDREALLVVGQEGDTSDSYASRPEASIKAGRELEEVDFDQPTDLFHNLTSCQDLLNYWSPIGRTMLIKCNTGGFFPPHKDEPLLTRKCFRVAAFIGSGVDHEAFEWEQDGHVWPIKPNRAYYIDTRKTHRTHTWVNDSYHLILNIPKTWENVIKLMSITRWY
jgi:hypothetical protein